MTGPSTTVRGFPENLTHLQFATGMKCIEAKQDAGLTELFDVLAHLQHQLPIEKGAFFI